jgi:hypothetical protein
MCAISLAGLTVSRLGQEASAIFFVKEGQPLSVLPVAFALGALLPILFQSKNASAAAIHAPPGFVFQIGSVCDSVAPRNQRVIVILCCV